MKDRLRSGAVGKRATGAKLLLDSAGDRLPTPDGVALAIMEACEDDQTTVQQLTRLVQTDPALSGRVLKLANSAATGHRAVASVPEAIVRVGMQTVGQLAVAFSLIGKDDLNSCPAFDHQQYWSRCLLMAVLSRSLAQFTRVAPPEDLFACGLLAQIGVLGFASVYPEAYSDLLASNPADLAAQEKALFGVDHNELSEAMMLDFCVPRALAEPARYHEAPEQSGFDHNGRPQQIATLLHLAYRLSAAAVHNRGSPRVSNPLEVAVDATSARLSIAEEAMECIFNDVLAEWQEWSELLQLPVQSAPKYQDLEFTPNHGQTGYSTPSSQALRVVVTAEPELAAAIEASLTALAIPVKHCACAKHALRLALNYQANVFFVSPTHDPLIRMVRNSEVGDASFIFTVLAAADSELETRAYTTGADDVITADIATEPLASRLAPALRMLERHERWRNDRKELRRIAKELALSHRQQQMLALTDQLTELPNRRAAMNALDQAWNRSLRSLTPCSLLILDIDHFKTINDRYGHAVGDQVLRATAAVLKDAVRRDETIARIGGEEFLLISTRLERREAVIAAERLRRQLERATLDAGGETIQVSVSIGIAVRETDMRQAEALMIAADKALYAAKNAGRNRVGLFMGGQTRVLTQ